MSGKAAASHYDVLGVSADASHDDVRRAYLACARDMHPDRHIDASPGARSEVERRMREINEAWHVLGDPRRRRRYDLERAPEQRFATRTDGTTAYDSMDRDALLDDLDATARLIRALPWIVLLVVLFGIFVFTAYAVTGGQATVRNCVITDGSTVTSADCGSPGARRVITTVDASHAQSCPAGTERLQPSTGSVAYCLEV